jgi:hypothetical protein
LLSDECPSLVIGNVNLKPGYIPSESYVENTTSSVNRTAAPPFELTVTNLNYYPSISDYAGLVTKTVGGDTRALRSCIQQPNSTANSTIYTLPKVAEVPFAAFTGEASPHIPYYHCMINYLNHVNVKTDWVRMADVGVQGNPRFGYLETKNIAYFNVVEGWISKLANSLGS